MLWDGRPGVHSARYAGDHAPQKVVLDKLLDEMKDVEEEKRTASFVCVLTLILENGEKRIYKGVTEGRIAKECGLLGKLTYMPVFIPNGLGKVMTELSEEEIKDTHRQKAWRELIADLELEK